MAATQVDKNKRKEGKAILIEQKIIFFLLDCEWSNVEMLTENANVLIIQS